MKAGVDAEALAANTKKLGPLLENDPIGGFYGPTDMMVAIAILAGKDHVKAVFGAWSTEHLLPALTRLPIRGGGFHRIANVLTDIS